MVTEYFLLRLLFFILSLASKLIGSPKSKEEFDKLFFKMLDNLQKLQIKIIVPKQIYVSSCSTNISDVDIACKEGNYSLELNQFFNLLFQILKYTEKSKVNDKMMYIDFIRPLLSQGILHLLKINHINDDKFSEYKKLVEKFKIL